MKNNNVLDVMLGQDTVFTQITACYDARKCLIHAPVGSGKHHLMNRLEHAHQAHTDFLVLHLAQNSNSFTQGQDFAPFLSMLSLNENTIGSNLVNVGKSFAELIPYIGKAISQVLTQKKIYPAIFSNTEVELLTRIERIAGLRNLVFFCEEIDNWDRLSVQFLQKLFSYPFSLRKVRFICSSNIDNAPIPDSCFDQSFSLRCISLEEIENALQALLPGHSLERSTVEKIHELSGGNIGIIIQLSALVEENGTNLIAASQLYRDVTIQRLRGILDDMRYGHAIGLLDRASIMGERVYKQLLFFFTKYSPVTFYDCINDVVENKILYQNVDTLVFRNPSVWNAFYSQSFQNKQFHYELACCLRKLMPSNYSYIADELLYAGQEKEATVFYILAELNYFRTYRMTPTLYHAQTALMKKHGLYDSYQALICLYSHYFLGDYSYILQAELYFKERTLAFEVDYVKALVAINGSIKLSIYKQTHAKLESWIEDEVFRSESPYQWMRAALLVLGVKFELHDNSMVDLLKLIEIQKRAYIASDKGIEQLEFDFLSKCNYCYCIDTAYHYTKQAVSYFKRNLANSPSMYPYYIALINFAANALVVGKYQECIQVSLDALTISNSNCHLFGSLDALINNLLIAELLSGQMQEPAQIDEALSNLQNFASYTNEDIISSVLLRNNLAVMMCYKGDILSAAKELEQLYSSLLDIDDVDDYYLYFVGSNACILTYFTGTNEFDNDRFQLISKLNPLSHDRGYFDARNQYIVEQMNLKTRIDFSQNRWNDFPVQKIGPAWSFWGKWLLFSDIQIWSD